MTHDYSMVTIELIGAQHTLLKIPYGCESKNWHPFQRIPGALICNKSETMRGPYHGKVKTIFTVLPMASRTIYPPHLSYVHHLRTKTWPGRIQKHSFNSSISKLAMDGSFHLHSSPMIPFRFIPGNTVSNKTESDVYRFVWNSSWPVPN